MKNTTEMLDNNPYLDSYKDAPWSRKNMVHEDENVVVYKDGFPVTEGHLLFVPKKKLKREDITICFEYAYKWGIEGVMDYRWEAFNVGINNGVAAGQSVMWPHVHLIPRRKGDTPNPRGGIRGVIPMNQDYDDKTLTIPHPPSWKKLTDEEWDKVVKRMRDKEKKKDQERKRRE